MSVNRLSLTAAAGSGSQTCTATFDLGEHTTSLKALNFNLGYVLLPAAEAEGSTPCGDVTRDADDSVDHRVTTTSLVGRQTESPAHQIVTVPSPQDLPVAAKTSKPQRQRQTANTWPDKGGGVAAEMSFGPHKMEVLASAEASPTSLSHANRVGEESGIYVCL